MKTPNTEARVKHYKSTLAKKMELISALNETIFVQVEEENIEEEIADSSEFVDGIDISLTTLEDFTRVGIGNVVAPPKQVTSSQEDQQVDESAHGGGGFSKVRLPKLHLPSFDGNFKDWSAFGTASIQQLI